MQPLIRELRERILTHLAKSDKLLGSPQMMLRTKGDCTIISGNFFFKDVRDIATALHDISEAIEDTVKSHIGIKGEIIRTEIERGMIWDSGNEYFEVKGGLFFEVYCFEHKTLSLVRLTWEKQLFDLQREWLSMDVDEICNTLWMD